jgi:peptide-methionine (R)-S-oxide reductase
MMCHHFYPFDVVLTNLTQALQLSSSSSFFSKLYMITTFLGIFGLPGKPEETRLEKDGEPLKHWKTLRESRYERGSRENVMWRPVDLDFWENYLSKQEYKALRRKRTEAPRSSVYDKFYPSKGHFCCRACGLELYAAAAKFDSKTGWPSFGEHVAGNVEAKDDSDYNSNFFMKRTEVRCRRCKSHLGHVFAEKNLQRLNRLQHYTERQCINGISIYYIEKSLSKRINSHATALPLK